MGMLIQLKVDNLSGLCDNSYCNIKFDEDSVGSCRVHARIYEKRGL